MLTSAITIRYAVWHSIERRQAHDIEQLPDTVGHRLALLTTPPLDGVRRGQTEQVLGRRLVELQDTGEGLEDLDGGIAVTTLLEPEVVVGTDAGKHGDFFASQSGDATDAVDGKAHAVRLDELTSSP